MAVISPIFPEELVDRAGASFMDQGFKRHVTEDIGRTIVLAKVPPQGRCVDSRGNVHIPSGTEFLFKIKRCHLSSSIADYISLLTVDDGEPPIYLSRHFRLFGHVIVPGPDDYRIIGRLPAELESSLGAATSTDGAHLDIPVRWISHALKRNDDEMVLIPVPEWLHERCASSCKV